MVIAFKPGDEHGVLSNGLLKIGMYGSDGRHIGSVHRGGTFAEAVHELRREMRIDSRSSEERSSPMVAKFHTDPGNRVSVFRCGDQTQNA